MLSIFEAAARIASPMKELSPDDITKAVLMALVAVGAEGLLVEPSQICLRTVGESSKD